VISHFVSEQTGMILSQSARWTAAASAVVALALLGTGLAQQQKGKSGGRKSSGPSLETAAQILKAPPRPKKPELPPSKLPLEFVKGERIALVGNSTAERMSLFGHFETYLHLKHPTLELVVRNFGRPAEEVGVHQRSADFDKLDDPLYAFNPDTFVCFFGWNESFKGTPALATFATDYEKFIDDYSKKYARDDAGSPPRFLLVSPLAVESSGDPLLPDAKAQNDVLRRFADVVRNVAAKRKLAFIDLFQLSHTAFNEQTGLQFTINGCHTNEAGDKWLGQALAKAMFGVNALNTTTSLSEQLRSAINDKSWVHMQDHRMVNGWYVYGGRRTFDTETFPREYAKIRAMAAVRDRYIWDLAQGKAVPEKPDDSKTGDLIVPPTRFGQPGQKYSEAPQLRYLSPEDFIASCKVAPGTEIKLFADETKFPELAKPVQINFDNKGRLWVACMPTYPQWRPGDGPPNDKLVILTDSDGDGQADKSTVFYDKLHCPTGFEFWNGGVLVVDQPRLLFLKDTDGDDKADIVIHLLDGWATDDTHHTCGAFEWSHGGLLHMLEGIATSTTLETPWGPHRSQGSGGAYVFDPRTQKIRQFSLPGMANMWCYVFDEWGNGIVGDGTTANQTWDTPLSGAQFSGRKGINFILPNGTRPNLGNEWIVSRALPDHLQKQFTYACVINLNGFTRYAMREDGAGFMGERVKTDKSSREFDDLIRSTDKHFRPCDPQIGPDGALWFGDWANALIGHMQYSQRDPNRDHVRGRIYRLVGKDLPPVKPVTQFGKTIPEILEQFREYEWRTRYRARRELRDRPLAELNAAFKVWLEANANDPLIDRFRCEVLWIQQSFHAVDESLIKAALTCKTPEARAAATHILADERDRVPHALPLLIQQSRDDHPRVRTEALRGLSFFPRYDAVYAAIDVALKPLDYWTKYTLESTLGATEAVWKKPFLDGQIVKNNVEASKIMTGILASSRAGNAATPFLKQLLDPKTPSVEVKNKAMTALMDINGNPSVGRVVFQRNCTSCHKVGNGEGQEYGPNLDKVATRLTKMKLLDSIIDPNADVEAKYLSTKVTTIDGQTIVGLLVGETKEELQIFDGTNKKAVKVKDIEDRKTLKQSSMPEGLAGTVSPAEFLDLMSYLYTLK
jgi:putative heme-binding domain-containing protein